MKSGGRPGRLTNDLGFGRAVVAWFGLRARDLPWRRRRDPWSVWVSEIMLQQTTVEAVAPVFERFMLRFPTLESLAAATEEDVLGAWAGLGYYRRARFLRRGAVAALQAGGIPRTFTELLRLPGLGPYTAGAVASLAFGEKAAAVDGNVARVLSRFEALDADPTSVAGRRDLEAVALRLMPDDAPGAFNEGLIELGATVCRPLGPDCGACPLRAGCLAYERGETARYPTKRARPETVAVVSARAVVVREGTVLLFRRPADASLLPGFDELPGAWIAPEASADQALRNVLEHAGFRRVKVGREASRAEHAITRHRITSIASAVSAIPPDRLPEGARFAPLSALKGTSVTTETRKLARRLFASQVFEGAS